MNEELLKIRKDIERLHPANVNEVIPLYPGIELCYLTLSSDPLSVQHKAMPHMIQINYCKAGQMVWEMKNGNRIYLNPGDFSLHTMKACTDSVIRFPNGIYQGLTVCIDLQEAAGNPPEPLKNSRIFETILPEKFCQNDHPVFLAGNEQTETIFSAFYNQPEMLKLPYQRIKVLEVLLYLSKIAYIPQNKLTEYQSELIENIHKIHDQLLRQMEQRITIEELSKQYLINPTTLKNAFKSVYGTSLAAHIKEHRMGQAAKMLKETDMTIAEIAQAVGYDSQSKFTAAFKSFYQVLPRAYRKK